VLKQELDRVSRSVSKQREVVQFHWAAARPTYLLPIRLEDLFSAACSFTFAAGAEIGNRSRSASDVSEHLETLRRLGFNRLSMGIQDFPRGSAESDHRIQAFELTRDS